MYASVSLRRLAVALALGGLAVCGLTSPLQAAPVPFNMAGSFTTTAKQGPNTAGTLSGTSSPGGTIIMGAFSQRNTGQNLLGTASFDFGGGNTVVLTYQITYDRLLNRFSGPAVITGGTGAFAGATGGGTLITSAGVGVGSSGSFVFSGTLSQ
jgi:hypothetical protein